MKQWALVLSSALILSACGSVGNMGNIGSSTMGIGSNLFSMYVQNQCTTELQSRTEWRAAALLMSQAQQTEWENKICGCVSEEAPNQITAAEMPKLLTESGRAQVIAEVGAKTVTACYKRLFTNTLTGK